MDILKKVTDAPSIPTGRNILLYEIVGNGTLEDYFKSLDEPLELLCLSDEEIKKCEKLILDDARRSLFILERDEDSDDDPTIVFLSIQHGAVVKNYLQFEDGWSIKYRHHFIVVLETC